MSSISSGNAGGQPDPGSKAERRDPQGSDSKPTPNLASDTQTPLDANVDRVETACDPEAPEVLAVRDAIGDALLRQSRKAGNLYLTVERDRIVEALTALRDDPRTACDYFAECVGVDYSRWTHERDVSERFEVVYNLMSVARRARVFVKIGAEADTPIPTARNVYQGAEFPEREIRDLFGLDFTGNALLPGTRFLLPDDWVGFPLRKEVPLGGEDVLFDLGDRGPAVEDRMVPHAGESFEGRTGSGDVSGR